MIETNDLKLNRFLVCNISVCVRYFVYCKNLSNCRNEDNFSSRFLSKKKNILTYIRIENN